MYWHGHVLLMTGDIQKNDMNPAKDYAGYMVGEISGIVEA